MINEYLDSVISKLRKNSRKGKFLQGAALIDRLERETGFDAAIIRSCLKEMRKKKWIDAGSWSATGNPSGRVTLNLPPLPMPPWVEQWKSTLSNCGKISDVDREALFDCSTNLSDIPISKFEKILDGLIRLREDQSKLQGHPAFIVSAQYLLGSSKMLSKFNTRSLKKFGINISQFSTHPPYVVTAGSFEPSTVILIENPTSFELAATSAASKDCAFISTFGFGLNKASEDFGNQLACMVENNFVDTITLVREGSRTPNATELLSHPNITFWGDLDIAGMQIYSRLAAKIPNIKLSALYRPMINAIKSPDNSHPYSSLVGKEGQIDIKFRSNRQDTSLLLELCRHNAVDQEIVTVPEIVEFAHFPLDKYVNS